MALSYPYRQNDEDKEIPTLTFVEDTMTPFVQLPPDEDSGDADDKGKSDGNDKHE